MRWTSLVHGLVCLLLLAAPSAAQRKKPKTPADYDTGEVYARVEDERDEVGNYWPYVLAVRAPEDDFELYRKALRLLRDERKVRTCYGYLHHLKDEAERARAIEFLTAEALGAPRGVHRIGATRATVGFKDAAHGALETIVAEARDEEARTIAIGPLIPKIAAVGSIEALERILSAADPAEPAQRQNVVKALARFDSAEARALLLERLGHHQTSDAWRYVLLERLADEQGREVTDAIAALLRRREVRLVERALQALGARGELGRVQKEVQRLLDSPDEYLRFVAIASAPAALVDEPRWRKKLIELSRHRDPVRRLAAVHALVELRTPEALEALYALLQDDDWRVRVAAVRGAATLRREDALPHLVEALPREEGRVRWEVVVALRHLTAIDLGQSPERWLRWWEAEGTDFVIPPVAEAEKQRSARVTPVEEQRSAASFYGLPVLSQRIAFVLDVSGSMNEPAVVEGRTVTKENADDGPRRIDIAKEQLVLMLKALPGETPSGKTPSGETRCNVVFFSSDVVAWQDQVVPMTAAARKDALRFVQEQKAFGGTNLFDALEYALSDELVDTLYVLSDGAPTSGSVLGTQPIREAVARVNSLRSVQIHCISVGRSSEVLRLVAEDARGEYREVGKPPPKDEDG